MIASGKTVLASLQKKTHGGRIPRREREDGIPFPVITAGGKLGFESISPVCEERTEDRAGPEQLKTPFPSSSHPQVLRSTHVGFPSLGQGLWLWEQMLVLCGIY